MTSEELQLLKENNEMLKYICSYINYKEGNRSSNQLENFIINLAADTVGNRMNRR